MHLQPDFFERPHCFALFCSSHSLFCRARQLISLLFNRSALFAKTTGVYPNNSLPRGLSPRGQSGNRAILSAHLPTTVHSPSRFSEPSPMDKRISSPDAAIANLKNGMTILMGGFGLCGIPENLIAAVKRKGTKDLTIVSNNAGADGFGFGAFLERGQVRRRVSTYVGENKLFEQLVLSENFQGNLIPQASLSDRLRA